MTDPALDDFDDEQASSSPPAQIVIVDDDPQNFATAFAEELSAAGVPAVDVRPEKLRRQHLEDAQLVLVDQRLDLWSRPRDETLAALPTDQQFIAEQPRTGIALAAIIRSHMEPIHTDSNDALPAAGDSGARGVALLSNALADLVAGYSPSVTEHAAARLHDLEWAFGKTGVKGLPDLLNRVLSLFRAIGSIRAEWGEGAHSPVSAERTLVSLLSLPDADWASFAHQEVMASGPPVHQYASATHGLSVLRWLAQRILPYPTFLLSDNRASLALGIAPKSFAEHRVALAHYLDVYRYRGPLADFMGPRWWRAGLVRLSRELTGRARPTTGLCEALAQQTGLDLQPMEPANAVLCVDETLAYESVQARENAVRITLDDWPAFAEAGWMSRAYLADHEEFWGLVDIADRPRS